MDQRVSTLTKFEHNNLLTGHRAAEKPSIAIITPSGMKGTTKSPSFDSRYSDLRMFSACTAAGWEWVGLPVSVGVVTVDASPLLATLRRVWIVNLEQV